MSESALLALARDAVSDLTPDEVAMIEAATTGRDCSFPDIGVIRPGVIRWICSDPFSLSSIRAVCASRTLIYAERSIYATLPSSSYCASIIASLKVTYSLPMLDYDPSVSVVRHATN